jgi:hypothetical protein
MATVKGKVTPNHVAPLLVDDTAAVPLNPFPYRPKATQSTADGHDMAATELIPSGVAAAGFHDTPPSFEE